MFFSLFSAVAAPSPPPKKGRAWYQRLVRPKGSPDLDDYFKDSFFPRYYRIAVMRFRSLPQTEETAKELFRQTELVKNQLELESHPHDADYSDLFALENAIIRCCPAIELPYLREQILVRYRSLAGDDDPIVLRYFQQASPNPHAITIRDTRADLTPPTTESGGPT
ncbi:hypothetical protein [Fimbriimonas ginsengisoli]|uniref:Uncharacterized protein n=1 Tax=Fimbriimonas ginsengisoli Gsoil 348 TaxID=661478 RepID=A0A068NSQ7_FIMGI|nr:hypothetical protein [Fimbriimonas ginsengisoli]AIE84644.1 hypothetical protein OP10G_1276 [Fimbriimonas ginsengisoli Gsoil 348]